MGAAFVKNGLQTQSSDNIEGVLDVVWKHSEKESTYFYKRGRDLDSPQHARDKAQVETVGSFGESALRNANLSLSANKVMDQGSNTYTVAPT